MGRVDLEVDGLAVDSLVGTGDSRRLVLNLPLDVGKVCEATARDVMELCPLRSPGRSRGPEAVLHGIWEVFILGDVDELEDKGSTGADATASREKVSADNVFENGGFSCGLGADNNLDRGEQMRRAGRQHERGAYNLRQVQRVVSNGVEDQVLKLVDGDEQILAEGSHDCG